ncbi:RluA family pseudouridine synthase [Candidatus Finniella inopinata]|uniref:Pseudouridine synthase n=1 Tax=Candidatus Finniella inopinata TaxID=1696036 RepID=A0A4Q7DKZ3_9PROT|nr:RluA family pseudouridine synthase [Candidatus Finniella inopinata]RZI47078.1 RluA family pseudouridine synthase [Candidatus Finniella inopinata]
MNPGDLKIVTEDTGGQRLDKFLAVEYPEYSRSRFQAWIEQGCVTKDGSPFHDCSYKVKMGEGYQINPPPAVDAIPQPQDIELDVIYEDDDVLVINKAPGLVVHPAPGHHDETLVNALLAHCGDSLSGIGGVKRPGIVHRLDKDTSGLMVIAKNDWAHQHLSKQFEPKILETDKNRTLKRMYEGLVWGCPLAPKGVIETYLYRHPRNRQKMAVSTTDTGRFSRTHYKVEATRDFGTARKPVNVSWVLFTLDTGRTHQIRIHSQHAGFPILGDPLYGQRSSTALLKYCPESFGSFNRQALHARELQFIHPRSNEVMNFRAPAPTDFLELLNEVLDG